MSLVQFHLGQGPTDWQLHWVCDGQAIGEPIPLEAATLSAARAASRRFLDRFESKHRPFMDWTELQGLGTFLFDWVLTRVWEELQRHLGAEAHQLVLRCDDPDLLNLPWELLELQPGLPVGCDPGWAVIRSSFQPTARPSAPLDPGSLRLLFLAAAPTDQRQLDFEREEDAMLRATGLLGQEVIVLPFAETGGIQELADLISHHRPHVVHLSGHASVDARGVGRFAFEDERGKTDARPVEELCRRLFRGSAVRCVVLNACQSSQATAAGLAQKLVEDGVPMVLGWAASVQDDRATCFAGAFYRSLAQGEKVSQAVARGRQEIWRSGREGEEVDATFVLPQLYAVGPALELADRDAPVRSYQGPRTSHALLEDGIKGLQEGFIGRRRVQQELVPALRDGTITFAVLHGLGGMGKSTLATRIANRLQQAGYTVYGVRAASRNSPEESGRETFRKLLAALGRALLVGGQERFHQLVHDCDLPVEERLRLAAQGLRGMRVLLVLDNWEDVLDLQTRRIVDPDLSLAYIVLCRDLTEGSRIIVTSRYLPAETPRDGPLLWQRDLSELSESEFYKYLRRDPTVEGRMRQGELTPGLLQHLYRHLGGTPAFLEQVRVMLRTADPDSLAEEAEEGEGSLEEERQRYYEKICLSQLYATLPPASQALASLLAVSELPLPADGLARLLGSDETTAAAAAEAGVVYGLIQCFTGAGNIPLYHPPGLVRPWLSAEERLSADRRQGAEEVLAWFWRESYEKGRGEELRVPIELGLMACRRHAERAGQKETWLWATVRLAGRWERVSEWRQARSLLEEVPEEDRDGACWHQLALIDLNEGNYGRARSLFSKAMVMLQAIGDRAGEAATWHNLASIDVNEGNYAQARSHFGKALEIKQAIGNRAGEAVTWLSLASIDLNEGNYAQARSHYGKALEIEQAIGDRTGEAATWHGLATIDFNEGNYAQARSHYGKTLEIRQAIGDRAGEAVTWHQIGFLAWKMGRPEIALPLVALSAALLGSIGHGNTERARHSLLGMCSERGLSEENVRGLLEEAATIYARDRGREWLSRLDTI
jgi:tetratricopeptide (TPR) repeat protein